MSQEVNQAVANLQAIKEGNDPRTHNRDDAGVVVEEIWSKRSTKANRQGPSGTYDRTRDEIHDKFLQLLNLVEPDHPHRPNENAYPAKTSDVRFSYHRRDSATWASCGPRRDAHVPFSFSVDLSTFTDARPAFLWMVLAHEVVHIEHGSHSASCGHRPEFWTRMAEVLAEVLRMRDRLLCDIPDDFVHNFVSQVYYDPNRNNVDRRSHTVEEQRRLLLDELADECRRWDLDVAIDVDW
jgi:hypothetical protein